MDETDRILLRLVGGPAAARVALIPAASGLEPGMPARWNAMGVEHFARLGATPVPLDLTARADAEGPAVVAELARASMIYFSGGNPEYLIETLRGTPAWATIVARHRAGAALAGCSAGAMMMGAHTIRVRQVAAGGPPSWTAALGVVPGVAVLPHFDRMAAFVGPEVFRRVVEAAPAGTRLVGIDEDTALVGGGAGGWRVVGRQSVTLLGPGGTGLRYRAGEAVGLEGEG